MVQEAKMVVFDVFGLFCNNERVVDSYSVDVVLVNRSCVWDRFRYAGRIDGQEQDSFSPIVLGANHANCGPFCYYGSDDVEQLLGLLMSSFIIPLAPFYLCQIHRFH